MLIDEVIAGGAPGCGCDISCLLPALRKAAKFVLTAEFASVAEALSEDYTGLVRVFDRCRLPFAQTWIEVVHSDRPGFSSARMHAENFQVRPKRVGYLLTATRPDLSAWTTHLFWSTELGCSAAGLAMDFDMTEPLNSINTLPTEEQEREAKASYRVLDPSMPSHPGWDHAATSVKLAMLQHTEPAEPAYGLLTPPGDLRTKKELAEFYGIAGELARADWAGEPSYLLAVVGLLNARNAIETETVNYDRLNKSRAQKGKPPLFEHKVLKIHHRQQHHVYGERGSRGDHAPMRQHFCRGHFKTRKSGIFFWNPHLRGDPARGRVEKDYELV